MMDNSNNQNQSRFLIAAVLSLLVLLGWSYFFAPERPVSNTSTNQTAANSAPEQAPVTAQPTPQPALTQPDTTPARTITINSPLYEVVLDSKGAVATSWILLKNKRPDGEQAIHAYGGDGQPLQLIPPAALEQSPQEVPFRLLMPDQSVTTFANERNYQIGEASDTVSLASGEAKSIEFNLTTETGLAVRKTFVFSADSYVADLSVDVRQNGQPVPNTKLAIGASIGDHSINHHNFYQIESESVARIDGDIYRRQGYYSFKYDSNNRATLVENGAVDWAGVGDAYFAMAAIPATPQPGLEYRAFKYDVQTEPFYYSIFNWVIRSPQTTETRHLVTAFVPITSDGSVTKIYTGTKDYFVLNSLGNELAGRDLKFYNLINFSNYGPIRLFVEPLSIPILYALDFFNKITQSYGLAIIVFTFLFYSLLFPLRWKQSKSFKKASANAPRMKELQEKIKELQKKGVPMDDPRMRSLQMEQLKLTKDALPIGGCLPMLLQFPLLIAFYTAITIALDARQASFLWLPDLSSADPWHVLEFGFAISMVLAMKFTPTAPAVSPEQQMQQKMMTYMMPVMMLWVMWTAPAGLLLYWLFGNVVSFGQQMIINRLNKTNEPPAAEVVDEVPKNAKKVKGKPKLSTS